MSTRALYTVLTALILSTLSLGAAPNKNKGGDSKDSSGTPGDPGTPNPDRSDAALDTTNFTPLELEQFDKEAYKDLGTEPSTRPTQTETLVPIHVGDKTYQLDAAIFPKEGPLTAQDKEMIRALVAQGDATLRAIHDGTLTKLTKNQFVAVMWALQVQGTDKVGYNFYKGAFSLPDKDGRLSKAILTIQEKYIRYSSHVKKEKMMLPLTRGIDFATFKPDQLPMPYGMKTVLIQSFQVKSERRLYLKMETEGSTLRKPVSFAKHLKNYFIRSEDTKPARREKLADDLKTTQQELLAALQEKPVNKDFKDLEKLVSAKRVFELKANLEQARGMITQKISTPAGTQEVATPMSVEALGDKHRLEKIKRMLDTLTEMVDRYEDADVRLGNEVVFLDSDLQA